MAVVRFAFLLALFCRSYHPRQSVHDSGRRDAAAVHSPSKAASLRGCVWMGQRSYHARTLFLTHTLAECVPQDAR